MPRAKIRSDYQWPSKLLRRKISIPEKLLLDSGIHLAKTEVKGLLKRLESILANHVFLTDRHMDKQRTTTDDVRMTLEEIESRLVTLKRVPAINLLHDIDPDTHATIENFVKKWVREKSKRSSISSAECLQIYLTNPTVRKSLLESLPIKKGRPKEKLMSDTITKYLICLALHSFGVRVTHSQSGDYKTVAMRVCDKAYALVMGKLGISFVGGSGTAIRKYCNDWPKLSNFSLVCFGIRNSQKFLDGLLDWTREPTFALNCLYDFLTVKPSKEYRMLIRKHGVPIYKALVRRLEEMSDFGRLVEPAELLAVLYELKYQNRVKYKLKTSQLSLVDRL